MNRSEFLKRLSGGAVVLAAPGILKFAEATSEAYDGSKVDMLAADEAGMFPAKDPEWSKKWATAVYKDHEKYKDWPLRQWDVISIGSSDNQYVVRNIVDGVATLDLVNMSPDPRMSDVKVTVYTRGRENHKGTIYATWDNDIIRFSNIKANLI
jgi:hypothetical protein